MFESDRYVVAQRLPFGIMGWAWSSVCVATKADGRLVEAALAEKIFLGAVMRELSRLRVACPGGIHERLFEQFAASVGTRGSATWQSFFHGGTPRAMAQSLVGDNLLPA